jgi:phospholipid/cholesterol/gamma-HCH transport system permease protein
LAILGQGSQIFVPRVISVSIIRELGPLITAIVMTGRMGAAIAAELGTMTVNEEIMALETSALSPTRFLVVPRMVAAFLMVPALTVFANLVGILGGGMICVSVLGMSWDLFSHEALHALVQKDLVTGMIKPFVFAIVVASISCHAGLSVSGGAEGVGRATTNAVVWSTVFIIITDAVCTWIFYYVFGA